MRVGSVLCLTLIAAVAFAGCADDAKPNDVDPSLPCDVCGGATAETGIVRGVVVDEAVRPITGVVVTLLVAGGETREDTTDDQGTFGFADVSPGDHFVKVAKAGYTGSQVSVAVVAGVNEPPAVRILMESDPESRPYVSVQQHTGFIECSFRVRDATGATSAVFGEPYYYGHNTCNGLGNQLTNFPLEFDMAPTWVQGELTWQSSQATGSGLSLVVGPRDCRDIKWDRGDGTSPQINTVNATVIQENADLESDLGTCFRVFTWSAPEFGDAIGAGIAQEFSLTTHIFYNAVPEEGWTFGTHGAPNIGA